MRKGLGGDPNPVPNSIETVNRVQISPNPQGVKAISPERVQIPDGIPQSRRGGSLHRAFIALGSNVGDRIGMIEKACSEMERRNIKVVRTSSLYETAAMYVTNQQSFINGACQIQTSLDPIELLDELKDIEDSLGRKKTVEKGPRNIDLDILLFDTQMIEHPRLSIPHRLMMEREFVLRPLCDLIPNETIPSLDRGPTFRTQLKSFSSSDTPLSPLTPLSPSLPSIQSLSPVRSTTIMAVLNLTPDSFSDGGLHSVTASSLNNTLQSFVYAGATILDVGGQSTRPHAPQVCPAEELSRILPTIQHMRSNPTFSQTAISVDTYRASIVSAAVAAGADIVNDVSAGTLDPELLPTVAKLGCTVVLMHMRGTPETMNSLTDYPDGVIAGVGHELAARVRAAEEAGIRRWRIILDPGIGFAKTQAQNLELLRRLDDLREHEGLQGLPWLVGTSRKGFIGKITGVKDARERGWGTAAAVTAAVKGGADIIRVHDVAEMSQVVKMADAIWRV
ncbi:trifunctional dihydropteroate synthetase [Hypocenomyce scalaris]|nr:trifunctional dihydropteroate synthetase [Hypocenomyce scalaris]